MNPTPPRLLLVYNADGGLLNAVRDTVWKTFWPKTYPCSLCALTYGWVAMRGAWRRFLDAQPHEKSFYHKDEFADAFPELSIPLPAILTADGGAHPEVLVSAAELDALPDLSALIALVESRVASLTGATVLAGTHPPGLP